jgi:hypothetical protein
MLRLLIFKASNGFLACMADSRTRIFTACIPQSAVVKFARQARALTEPFSDREEGSDFHPCANGPQNHEKFSRNYASERDSQLFARR